MSYDFRLFKLSEGVTIEDAVGADEPEEGAPGPRPTMLIEGAEREAVIATIAAFDPTAERFQGASCVEFTATEGDSGVQVAVYEREISATIPYWHRDEKAREILDGMLHLLGSMSRAAGLIIYDPQLGRALDPGADLDAVLSAYGHTRGAMDETMQDPEAGDGIQPERRPWWKFW